MDHSIFKWIQKGKSMITDKDSRRDRMRWEGDNPEARKPPPSLAKIEQGTVFRVRGNAISF